MAMFFSTWENDPLDVRGCYALAPFQEEKGQCSHVLFANLN